MSAVPSTVTLVHLDTTFACTFASTRDANAVPDWVRFSLDEGVDIVETLTSNNAKWQSCRDSMNAT